MCSLTRTTIRGSRGNAMKTQIMPADERALRYAGELIAAGEVVAFHTETVYGLGADAANDEAVKKVFALKGRPADNPLIAHVHPDYDISQLVETPAYTQILRERFLPGPLTMVYPSKGRVSPYVSCGLDTLSLRVPSSPVAQAFLRAVDRPIAAPSANRSKHVSPVTAQHVADDFSGEIPLILDGGASRGGIESTVLDCTGSVPQILRAGLVTREMIAAAVGDCGVYRAVRGEKPKSPGMAYKHYAPSCRTAFFARGEEDAARRCYGSEEGRGGTPYLLCDHAAAQRFAGLRVLDLGDSPEEMAAKLYALLREGERRATLLIAVEPHLTGGVMDGVRNRFMRAFGRET